MMESRKRERIRKAPGLKLERLEKGAGESCAAAEETRECTSNLLYTHGDRLVARVQCFSLPLGYIVRGRVYPNDGHAVENQVERNTTGQMGLVNVNGELDR